MIQIDLDISTEKKKYCFVFAVGISLLNIWNHNHKIVYVGNYFTQIGQQWNSYAFCYAYELY